MSGIGVWMIMAAFNNLLDPQTNTLFLRKMMSMEDIKLDGRLGQGLLFRSLDVDSFVLPMLRAIAFMQIVIGLSLLASAVLIINVPVEIIDLSVDATLTIATSANMLFAVHWLFFLIGGLWFGYWIKMGKVQIVHFTMLILSLLLQLLISSSI